MKSNFVIVLLIFCVSSSRGEEDTATSIDGNSTLDEVIRLASEDDNEVLKMYSPADFLFNSCGQKKYKPTEEFSRLYPYYLSGFDGEGRPIWVVEYGKFDMNRVTSRGQAGVDEIEAYMNDVVFNLIRSLFLKPTPGRPTFQFNFIIDLEGLQAEQVTLENLQIIKKFCKQYRRMVNEYVSNIVFLNVNEVALKLGDVFRPYFEESIDRFEAFKSNKLEWLPFLKKTFPNDQLAPWYGGSPNFKPFRVYP